MGKISSECKANILCLSRLNLTTREISRRLNVAQQTVAWNLKKYRETGTTSRKKGSGRPKKTTPVEDRFLVLYSRRHRFKTSVDLKNDLCRATGKIISSSSVRKRLVKAGLRALKPVLKPDFPKRVREKRLLWAQEHLNWTQDMWNNVIFSDESKFKLHVGDGRILARREPKERLSSECILRMPPKTEGVMVWGCFSGDEKGRMVFLESKVTAEVYLRVLENVLEPSALELFGDTCRFIFQQDNAPCHTAKIVSMNLFFFNMKD